MRLMPLLVALAAPVSLAAQATGPSEYAPVGYTLQAPAESDDGVLRVLVYHDMEGLSGQDDWRTYIFRYEEQYRIGQQLLIADLNAVIDGLFAGGADEVHIVDGHGSGNPEPDIPSGMLDPRAEQLFRDEPFDPYTDLVEPGRYDAVGAVGMHAKTGSGGYASHTISLGTELWLQGRSITETELVGFSWGRVGVPVIFASGDDRLGEDLHTMPWIEYVTVKEALSADSARLRPVAEARADLRDRAKRAVEKLSGMRVMRVEGPVRAAVRAVPPASLEAMEGLPVIDYEEGKVSFTATDFESAYDGWRALIRVAQLGYMPLFFEAVEEHPEGEAIMDAALGRLDALNFDYESGRWNPPPPPAPEPGRKHHGYH